MLNKCIYNIPFLMDIVFVLDLKIKITHYKEIQYVTFEASFKLLSIKKGRSF